MLAIVLNFDMVRFEKQDRSPAFSLLALKCDSVHFARKLGVSKLRPSGFACQHGASRRSARSGLRLSVSTVLARACYELGRKSHRNADSTVGLVPLRSTFPAFLSRF